MSNEQWKIYIVLQKAHIAHCSLLIAHCSLGISGLPTAGSWRGRKLAQSFDEPKRLDLMQRGMCATLSPGERAGVRGKETSSHDPARHFSHGFRRIAHCSLLIAHCSFRIAYCWAEQ